MHLKYVDGIRALAALYVVCDHAALQAWPIYDSSKPVGWQGKKMVFACFYTGILRFSIFIVAFRVLLDAASS